MSLKPAPATVYHAVGPHGLVPQGEPPPGTLPPKLPASARSGKPRLSIDDLARARRACVPCNAPKAHWEDLGWLQRWADAGANPQADFDRYLTPTPAEPVAGPLIYGWLHIAILGDWQRISRELFSQVERSGLRGATSKVFVGVVGPEADLSWFPPWAEVVKRDGDIRLGENSTLEAMWAWAKTAGAGKVWYVHVKGASHPNNANLEAWRDCLTYFNVLKWRDCVAALDTHDVAACDYIANAREQDWFLDLWHARDTVRPGSSGSPGNFWWSRTEYLASLPADKVDLTRDRWGAEWRFIGSGNPRVAVLHDARHNFYAAPYPRSRYNPDAASRPG